MTRRFCSLLLLAVTVAASASRAAAETVRVAAAVSLKEAVTEIAKRYESATGDKVEFTFGASGQLAAQIKGGAPVDAFISAAEKQVDALGREGLIDAATRRVVAGNTLVLIVPAESGGTIDSFESFVTAADVRRVAVGEPKTVPAGEYAMQTLDKLKLTKSLAGKLVYGANVRQVLDYVSRAEVAAGVVYATDARAAGAKVKVVATAPPDSHDPIVYPAAVVAGSRRAAAARRFLDHLGGDEARRVLKDHGFSVERADAGERTGAGREREAGPGRRP